MGTAAEGVMEKKNKNVVHPVADRWFDLKEGVDFVNGWE